MVEGLYVGIEAAVAKNQQFLLFLRAVRRGIAHMDYCPLPLRLLLPVLAGGYLLIARKGGTIAALNPPNGKLIWLTPAPSAT